MPKSKYEINPIDIMKMSTDELKAYIRGASKTLGKRIKAFESMPYGGASETLTYLGKNAGAFSAGRTRFATRGLSRGELIAKANAVNVLASINETPGAFKKSVREEINTLIQNVDNKSIKKIQKIFEDKRNFEFVRDFVDIHMDSIYSLISSERINELANKYEEDTEKFYAEVMKETIKKYNKVEKQYRRDFFQEKRKKRARNTKRKYKRK